VEFKVLYIDASTRSFRFEKISDPNIYGIIDLGLKVHIDLKSYEHDPLEPGNPLVLGIGPLAGGAVVGSHRIVAVFRSPVSMGCT
jgi:Aldehyde:ferredoxin oxidoreductase